MSLEILISKYLDSELSEAEDLKLRDVLRDSVHSKSKFDSAVDVHHQLKQDAASIHVPEKLLRDTEDKILMSIMANQHASAQIIKPVTRWYQYSAAAVILLGLMISGVLEISEQNLPREIAFIEKSNDYFVYSDNAFVAESEDVKSLISSEQKIQLESESIPEISTVELNNTKTTELLNDNLASVEKLPILNDENENREELSDKVNILPSDKSSNLSLDLLNNPINFEPRANYSIASNLPPTYFAESFTGFAGVQLHTFMSYDFVHSGFKTSGNSPILNISQSISYTASDRLGFGIEFGITEFAYDRKQNIIIPGNINKNNGPTVQVPTGGSDNNLVIPVEIETTRQFLWGTAFMDYAFVKTDNFVVNGRIGLGGSNEGPLGFGRVYAQYDLFRYLSLTIGTEGRLFINDLPYSEFGRAMRSSSAVVYGIRLKF